MAQISENNTKKILEANELKSKLEGKLITIEMEANETGSLYGNVGTRQISKKLKDEHSVEVDQGNIILGNIKELGNHSVTLRLYDEISVSLSLEIVKRV